MTLESECTRLGLGKGCSPAMGEAASLTDLLPPVTRSGHLHAVPLPHGNGSQRPGASFQPGPVRLWASHSPSLGLRNTEDHCSALNGSSYLHLAKNYTCAHNMVPANEASGSI